MRDPLEAMVSETSTNYYAVTCRAADFGPISVLGHIISTFVRISLYSHK
jgi:hypothetical protein